MVKSKGAILIHYKEALKHFREYKKVIDELPYETRKVFDSEIKPNEIYDDVHHRKVLEVIYNKLGEDELIKVSGRVGREELSGFFGLVIKFLSMERLAKQSLKLWKKMFDEGELEIKEVSKEKVRFEIKDFYFSKPHLIAFIYYIKAWFTLMLKKDSKACFRKIREDHTEFTYMFD